MTTYESIMSVIAKPMGLLLELIYNLIPSYGITLIVFTLIVRGCLFPVYASQIKGSMRMKDIQPKMQAIQRKYANDKQQMNVKLMELYKEEKYNPARGCLPLLIQMPIILALFVLLRNPTAFIETPQMIMAVHEPFLWIPDLSQPDSWILPIATGVAQFFAFSFTPGMGGQGADVAGTAGMMKMMKYFFPIMLVWMARAFPSGLAVYWFVGTLFMIAQSLLMSKWRKKQEARATAAKA
ncbi:MAG TPA: membrane protein insertase YidC [Clostridiales bacterium]|jgi:YidC/Oxa1 family membrane protein insertase|nr:membrane protein insertase YidC [Clostridiales bacterium]